MVTERRAEHKDNNGDEGGRKKETSVIIKGYKNEKRN